MHVYIFKCASLCDIYRRLHIMARKKPTCQYQTNSFAGQTGGHQLRRTRLGAGSKMTTRSAKKRVSYIAVTCSIQLDDRMLSLSHFIKISVTFWAFFQDNRKRVCVFGVKNA